MFHQSSINCIVFYLICLVIFRVASAYSKFEVDLRLGPNEAGSSQSRDFGVGVGFGELIQVDFYVV